MKYGSIPGVTKPVSRLVQGTANTVFDPSKPDQAFALLDMAMEYGINTFDTAHVYGEGNETMLGNWIRERGVRDQVVILAKGAHPYGGHNRVTPEDIEADLTESLRRQKSDYFDLYVLHRDDPAVPVGPIVEALEQAQRRRQDRRVRRLELDVHAHPGSPGLRRRKQPDAFCRFQPELQPGRDVRPAVGRLPFPQRSAGAGRA